MQIKICGLRDPKNIAEILTLNPEFIGLNFYQKSSRFVDNIFFERINKINFKTTKKVGVFVNATIPYIKDISEQWQLDYVQLHGNETPNFCKNIAQFIKVIKVFRIKDNLNLNEMALYTLHATYFLLDKYVENFGGSGKKFDWQIIKNYKLNTPLFLSGGINVEDAPLIKNLDIFGVDINSKFEKQPAIKDFALIKQFINKIKQ